MVTWSATIVFGIIEAFAPNYIVFVIVRFFMAATGFGLYLAGCILGCEYVGPSWRNVTGMIYPMFFSVGIMVLAPQAYLIRQWWSLQLAIIVPCVLLLCYWWIIPESPRWLISKGRIDEAESIIRRCCRINKVAFSEEKFSEAMRNIVKSRNECLEAGDKANHSLLSLFRYPNMRKKTLILFFNWVTICIVYYGISFDTSSLGGNPYVNMLISGAVEIPAGVCGLFLIDHPKFGRWGTMILVMISGGVACIILTFVPPCGDYVWIGITLAMTGKLFITAGFSIIYLYSAELFPTPLRSTGVGMCSSIARVGAMIAPQLIFMSTIWEPLFSVVSGITSIVAGLLIIPLPETRGRKLPETLMEAEEFEKKHKPNCSYQGYGEIRKVEVNDIYEMNGI
ncbi:organic cation transporter protein-like [Saccoglossus kowalevskii]